MSSTSLIWTKFQVRLKIKVLKCFRITNDSNIINDELRSCEILQFGWVKILFFINFDIFIADDCKENVPPNSMRDLDFSPVKFDTRPRIRRPNSLLKGFHVMLATKQDLSTKLMIFLVHFRFIAMIRPSRPMDFLHQRRSSQFLVGKLTKFPFHSFISKSFLSNAKSLD